MTTAPVSPGVPTDRVDRILAAFHGEVQRPPVRARYRAGLVVCAVAATFLPLVYVGMIGLVAWGLIAHLLFGPSHFESFYHSLGLLAFTAYLVPVVPACLMIVFMLKPLFAVYSGRPRSLQITAEQEPIFFAFVERVAEALGAPRPQEVGLTLDANASAAGVSGFGSLFRRKLRLEIGMPLWAGMSVEQLGGVVAHELGHFAQGGAMRASFVIRWIESWFARVVFEHDGWDSRILRASQSRDLRIRGIMGLSRFFIWITRGFVRLMLHAGTAASNLLGRQMELAADRDQVLLAGSAASAAALLKLRDLDAGVLLAWQEADRLLGRNRRIENLPELIVRKAQEVTDEQCAALDRARLLDIRPSPGSHPAREVRLAAALHENVPGVLSCPEPARVLAVDFEALSRRVTAHYYRQLLGESFDASLTDQTPGSPGAQIDAVSPEAALIRVFGARWVAFLPVNLREEAGESPAPPSLEALRQARAAVLQWVPSIRPGVLSAWDANSALLERTWVADACFSAGIPLPHATFGAELGSASDAAKTRGRLLAERQGIQQRLIRMRRPAVTRLAMALAALDAPAIADSIPDAPDLARRRDHLLSVLAALEQVRPALEEALAAQAGTHMLVQLQQQKPTPAGVPGALRDSLEHLVVLLSGLRQSDTDLSSVLDGLAAEPGVTACGRHLVPELPSAEAPDAVLDSIATAQLRWIDACHSAHARVALLGENLESALGMELLPDPA